MVRAFAHVEMSHWIDPTYLTQYLHRPAKKKKFHSCLNIYSQKSFLGKKYMKILRFFIIFQNENSRVYYLIPYIHITLKHKCKIKCLCLMTLQLQCQLKLTVKTRMVDVVCCLYLDHCDNTVCVNS